jgi:hypothetical protein
VINRTDASALSFSGDYCYMCKDQAAADAEYRYRFWAMFQDEKDGPTLPVQFDHRLVVGIDFRLLRSDAKAPAHSRCRTSSFINCQVCKKVKLPTLQSLCKQLHVSRSCCGTLKSTANGPGM